MLAGGCFHQSMNATLLLNKSQLGYEFTLYTSQNEIKEKVNELGLVLKNTNLEKKNE